MGLAEEPIHEELTGAGPEPESARVGPSTPAVLWADFQTAVRALTILWPSAEAQTDVIGRSALFYPLVGLMIGIVLCALDYVLGSVFTQEIASVLVVATLAVTSGGRQLEGFANTADGLIGGRARDWALAIMRDRRLGTFGAAAVFFLLVLKIQGIDLLSEQGRLVGFLCAPVLGRWAMVVLAHGSREAGPQGEARKFDREVRFREFGIASAFAFLVLLALAEELGLFVLVVVAAVTVGLRIYFHRRLGGITGQTLGAAAETAETLALVLFAMVG